MRPLLSISVVAVAAVLQLAMLVQAAVVVAVDELKWPEELLH